jgi:hypothetical protein
MSKTTKTDEPTTEPPSIEENIEEMSTAILDEFDAFMQEYARGIKTPWRGLTTLDRDGHAQLLLRIAGAGLRKPAVAASIYDLPLRP